jgi:KEOPS complex subunit Cgi121
MQDIQKDILSEYAIEVRSYSDNVIDDIPSFLKKIDEITSLKEDSIIQLLDCDNICGLSHLNQGIFQAIKSFDEKQNFAKDKGLEICVRTSAQKQISQALKILGIKNQCNITAVYINADDEQIILTENLLSAREDGLLEMYDEENITEVYGLNNYDNIVDAINEKIALLALKN